MPYAADEMLCTSKLDNGKEISEKEYCDAVRAVEEGAKVKIVNGEVTLLWREQKTLYNVIDGQSDVFELWPDEDFPENYIDIEPPGVGYSYNDETGSWESFD